MRIVTVKMPEVYIHGIEQLVKSGRYSSRSEVIRIAVRELLKRELWGAVIPAQGLNLTLTPVGGHLAPGAPAAQEAEA